MPGTRGGAVDSALASPIGSEADWGLDALADQPMECSSGDVQVEPVEPAEISLGWWPGWPPRLLLAAAIVLFNAGDVVTTRLLLAAGGREMNPLAGWLLGSGYLFPVKVGLAVLIGVLMLVVPLRRRS